MSTVVDFPTSGPNIGLNRKPKRFDIEVYQGDTFSFYLEFEGVGLDTTGWTASSTVKKVSDKVAMPGVISIGAIDTTNNRFLIDVDSDTLTAGTEYMYDVQVTDSGGNKRTFIGGKVTTTEDITEP